VCLCGVARRAVCVCACDAACAVRVRRKCVSRLAHATTQQGGCTRWNDRELIASRIAQACQMNWDLLALDEQRGEARITPFRTKVDDHGFAFSIELDAFDGAEGAINVVCCHVLLGKAYIVWRVACMHIRVACGACLIEGKDCRHALVQGKTARLAASSLVDDFADFLPLDGAAIATVVDGLSSMDGHTAALYLGNMPCIQLSHLLTQCCDDSGTPCNRAVRHLCYHLLCCNVVRSRPTACLALCAQSDTVLECAAITCTRAMMLRPTHSRIEQGPVFICELLPPEAETRQ